MTAVLSVKQASVHYHDLPAVRSVDLDVEAGQITALIGETGCGKTSLALAVTRLLPREARLNGSIVIDGIDVVPLSRHDLERVRSERVGFIAQDAMAALNPVLPVHRQIAEIYEVHRGASRSRARQLTLDALESVQIRDPERVARGYAHQLSGGMRQRVMIAMALALRPAVVVGDEPTTALDVSVQADILRLMRSIAAESGTAVLWITHDMGVVAEAADSLAVMYGGRIVETGEVNDVFSRPRHPYTVALLRTLQDLRSGERGTPMYQVPGQPPSLGASIAGCRFHPRCPAATAICRESDPPNERLQGGEVVACHHPEA